MEGGRSSPPEKGAMSLPEPTTPAAMEGGRSSPPERVTISPPHDLAYLPQWRGGAVAPRSTNDLGPVVGQPVAAMEGGRSSPPEAGEFVLSHRGGVAAMEGGRSSPPELWQRRTLSAEAWPQWRGGAVAPRRRCVGLCSTGC